MKKLLVILVSVAVCLLSILACEEEPKPVTPTTVPVQSVKVDAPTIDLEEGGTAAIKFTVTPSNATNQGVSFASSNPSVVAVDAQGNLTAKGPGTATITVTTKDGGKTASVTITVKEKPVAVAGIEILNAQEGHNMVVGDPLFLRVKVYPEDAANQNFTAESSDPAVVKIDRTEKKEDYYAVYINGLKGGKATVTVTTEDGSHKSSTEVNVTDFIEITSLTLSPSSINMDLDEVATLTAIVEPENATARYILWESSDTDVVNVQSTGMNTARVASAGYGTATITAKSIDGKKTATCTVTVKASGIPVSGIEFYDYGESTIKVLEGDIASLRVTVHPSDAADKTITAVSSDPSILQIVGVKYPDDSDYSVVGIKGLKEGTVTITATTANGAYSDEIEVTVEKYVPVQSITFAQRSITIEQGKYFDLPYTIAPDNATYRILDWTSSNAQVATANTDGRDHSRRIKALSPGTATITATSRTKGEEAKTATCTVTVIPATVAVTGVSLNKSSLTLTEGGSETLTATVQPSNATDKGVTWKSSNTSVATVSSSGKVTAVKAGTATVTVTTVDGGKTATCTVTVNAVVVPVKGISLSKSVLEMNLGAAVTVSYTIQPSNATNKKITAKSDNSSIATVRIVGSGNIEVTGVAAGTTYVRVFTEDGNYTAYCKVTVFDPTIHVTGISFYGSLPLGIYDGGPSQTASLTYTITPSNATDKAVTWSSSNTSIVSVDSNGIIKGLKEGKANITVRTVDGGFTATRQIIVSHFVPVSSIVFKSATVTVPVGWTVGITATVAPADATIKTLDWKSSDTSVLSIVENSTSDPDNPPYVKGLKPGVVTLTATSRDGRKVTGSCTVTVYNIP